ncbi:MAG: hypothetical protein ACREMS_06940 [Gemmatimonadaceae bacterium]
MGAGAAGDCAADEVTTVATRIATQVSEGIGSSAEDLDTVRVVNESGTSAEGLGIV